MGRPRKINAKKPGDLNEGECRFTFICESDLRARVLKICKDDNFTIKEIMNEALARFINGHYKKDRNTIFHFRQPRWKPLAEE